MIPKQEPTFMDVIANCLIDFEGAFKDAQSKRGDASPQPGFSGWTGPLFAGFPTPTKSAKNCPYKAMNKCSKPSTVDSSTHFAATFDVSAFDPSNVSVKVEEDSFLEVHAKEEKTAEDGSYELREFLKKVPLPETVLTSQLKCTVDEKGQLQVLAPLKKKEEDTAERVIPVQFVSNSKKTNKEENGDKAEVEVPEVTVEDVGAE